MYLRAFEYEDLPFINQIRNDDTFFTLTTGNKYYISSERDKIWIEDKIFNNYNQLYLIICSKVNNDRVGYLCANKIDYLNRKAEVGGIVIAKEFACRGYATDALRLFMEHLFEELGMNMIYCFVLEHQDATLKLMKKFGFNIDGFFRDYVFKQGKFHNAYIGSLLKKEYDAHNSMVNTLIFTEV